jgi:zinc protease
MKLKFSKSVNLLILSLLWVNLVFAQDFNATAPLPFDSNVKTGKLANGLTYYIRKNAKPEKRVELRLVVNAGSILEDNDQLGLAHFTEHMCFNGTKNFPKNELVNYLQSQGVRFGADLNAYTSFDETVYMLPIPSDKPEIVEKGLQILRDWAGNVTFDNTEIDKERGVVIEEWRIGRGADQRMRDKWLPVMLKGSRYAERLPIGTKEILEGFKYETIKKFYKDWYRPDLMAVIAVGDIDVAQIEAKIKATFSSLKKAKKPRSRSEFEIPDHKETLVSINADKEAPFTQVQVIYKKSPQPFVNQGDMKARIQQELFTGMLNQRFEELTQKAEPPFIFAGAFYGDMFRTKEAYQMFSNVPEKGIEKALQTLLEENKRVKKYGFLASELERYKKELLNQYERAFNERAKTESERYVDEYVSHFLEKKPAPGIEFEYNFLKTVLPTIQLTDVNALAEKWITDENMVVIITAPEKEGVVLPTEDKVRQIIKNVAFNSVKAYEEKALAASLVDANSITPGSVKKEVKNDKIGTTELTLSNGIRVVLKPTDFKNDEILMSAYSPGGTSLASDEDMYSAQYVSDVIRESGVKDFSATDLQKMMSGKTAQAYTFISQLTEGAGGNAAPKDLETMLQMLYLYFTAPRKNQESFQSFISKNKGFYQNLSSNPQFYFQGELIKILAQNHPRASGLPKSEDLDKINLDKAFQFYQNRFGDASDFTFLFVGNFKVDEIKPLLERYLGGLPAQGRQETWKDLGIRPPKGKIEKVISKGADPKSQVSITFTGETKFDSKDNYLLVSLGQLLSNKLIDKIREEKSGVYGIGARGSMNKNPYESFNFSISFPCAPENVDNLIAASLDEIKKIQAEGPSQEDINKIKESQKREYEVNIKQNRYWLSSLQKAYNDGSNPEEILNAEKKMEMLTAENLKAVAKKYLDLNSYIRVVLMPEAKK